MSVDLEKRAFIALRWHKEELQVHMLVSYFLMNASVTNTTDIRRGQLLLRKEPDPFKLQLHSFGIRGWTGVGAADGAGHLSQSTAMDLGVTSSWFSPPFFSTQ